MNSQIKKTPLLETPVKTSPSSSVSYYTGDLSLGYVAEPSVWRSNFKVTGSAWERVPPLHGSVIDTTFISSLSNSRKWESGVYTRHLCDFDMRIKRLRDWKPQVRVVSERSLASRPDPKYLPWKQRFLHWAMKTYENRSNLFRSDFRHYFNRNPYNKIVFNKIARQERRNDWLRNKELIAKRDLALELARLRKGFLAIQPQDAGEFVPSCKDDLSGPTYVPNIRQPSVDDESWYNPDGLYMPEVASSKPKLSSARRVWKAIWQAIAKLITARKSGDMEVKPPLYVHSSEPSYQRWADLKFDVKNLDRNDLNSKPTSKTINQSETARTVEANVECSEKGNTIFMEQSGVSSGETNVATSSRMLSMIPETNRFSALSNREIVLETFIWKNDERGTKLKEYSLPAALVKLRKQNPTAIPFQIHTFSNCDFIIRVRANPSQFQSGQLQCSWLYDPTADVNINNRLNIFSLSQTNHCLINAGTGNIGEIHVKYINPLSTLPAISSDLTDDSLNLGKFYIFVLNKLECPDTVAKECEVTVSIELLNATYSGSKDYSVGNFVYPQAAASAMVATVLAEKLLENTNTPNNDNPPYQGSRIAMVPQSNQSFCLGNSLPEPTNALRLDAVGQHKSVISGPNEMTVEYVSKVYGLVAIKEWTNKLHSGDKIHSFDASPLFDKKEYEGLTLGTDTAYRVPPVGVLSSLYSYWSGELRMRIDFVASRFHTGRLLLCYVPLYLDDITLDQAYSYPYQIFDLREGNQSVTFNIPYMSMLPMYPRRAGYTNKNDRYVPPGRVHIFVVNSLVSIANISDHVDMNIYWGAGDNFNVFVPAQPSLITSFFPDNVVPSTDIKADPGMFPWYMGNDYEVTQYVGDNGLFVPAIARYSAFPDRISTFANLKYGYYYKFKNTKATHYATMGYWETGSSNKLRDEANDYYSKLFWVPIFYIDDSTYSEYKGRILGACRTLDDVKAYYKDTGSEAKPNALGLTHLLGITDFATSGYTDNNPIFEGNVVPPSDFEMITVNQVDERVVGGPDEEIYAACKVYPIAAQLNKDLVGEKFGDLKTYCRRYQPYGLTKVVSTETYGDAMCTFPALPTGLDIDLSVSASNYPRFIREGPLQVILSGFRYYSGGMRFAIATTSAQFTMWVQHRADYEGNNRIETLTNTKTSANLLNAGYAQYLQSLKVNNIVQVEVPYYKNRNCLYAQRVNRKLKRTNGASSLGQVYIGIEGSKKDEKMVLTIFSSVADDFQAYAFQGFPPMIFVDDLQRNTTQSFSRMAHHQMFSIGLNEKQITEVTDQVLHKVNLSVEENLKKFVSSAEQLKPDFSGLTNVSNSLFADILGHVGHCLISPTKRSICWAFVHMFLKYGLIVDGGKSHLLSKIVSPISKLFSNLPDAQNNDVSPSSPTQSVNAGDDDDILAWFSRYSKKHNITVNQAPNSSELLTAGLELSSIIFSMIAGMHGLKSDNLSMFNPRKFSRIILESVTAGSRTYRFVLPFFKAVHEVVMKSIEWVTLYKNPHLIFVNAIQKELPLIAEWHERVEEIIDARNEEKVLAQDSPWCEIVEEAYVMGVQLGKMYMKFIEGETDDSVDLKHGHTMFMKTFTELCRVRNDMLKRGLSSINRREPFCIWVAGKAGIGKSQLSQRLIPDLLKTCKIPYRGEHTFTIQSGVEYWNGVGTQPCILLDDFLAVDCGQMKDQALSDYMRIKSPSTLNPNMASLHDKNLRISPELFYINCNQIYPRPVGVGPDAFLRRRDIVIEAVLAPELSDKFDMLKDNEEAISKILDENLESLDDFDHLRFKIYNNVIDPAKGCSDLLTFKQMRVILLKKFRGFHERQIHLFNMAHAAYEKQWENEEIPHSLKDTRDEHRNAMKFLSKFGPKPDVNITEFFRIVKLFSKGTPLTSADRDKIILLYQDSAKYQNEKAEKERKKEAPPMTPEEKIVEGTVTTNQVLPLISPSAAIAANPFATGYILGVVGSSATSLAAILAVWAGGNYYRKHRDKKALEAAKRCNVMDKFKLTRRQLRALSEFDKLAEICENKIDFEVSDLASLTYTPEERLSYKDHQFEPLDSDSCVGAALMCHPNVKISRRARKLEEKDFKKMTLPFDPISGSTIRIFDLYVGIEEDGSLMEDNLDFIVIEHIHSLTEDGKTRSVRDYEVLCDCGPFRFCHNSDHWGIFDELYVPKHLCGCHRLTTDYVWDEAKKVFTAIDKPDVSGPSCKMEGCPYINDKSVYKAWVKANYQAVKLGCCPEMLKFGKVKSWFVWLKDECIVKVKSFGKSFWEFITCEFWQLLYRAIVLGFGMFASFWLVNKLLSLIMPGLDVAELDEPLPPPDDHAYVQVQGSGDIKASKDHFKTIKPSFGKVARLESGYNFNQNTIEIINKIKKNTYILRSPQLKEKYGFSGMRVFFIYSNNICFQKHYYELIISDEYKAYTDWELFNPTTGAIIPVTPSLWNVKLPKTNQLGYARVTEAPQHRSLLGNIASEKAHEKSFGPCYVVTIDELSCNMISVTPYRQSGVTVSPTDGMSGYVTNVVYAYPWSAPGYCGSILLNTNLQQPIIGVHTAGNPDEGYAEPISNTMFSAWLKYQIEEFESDQIAEDLSVSTKLKGNFIPIGKIHPVFTKRESGTTHECPSLVHGEVFPVVSQPAPLSNKDPRMPEGYSPLFAGVNNMFKPPKVFPEGVVSAFCDHMAISFIANAKPLVECRRRTYEEAILGVDGVKYFDSLDMATSEGFPFSRQRPAGVSNKSWLFNIENRGKENVSVTINKDLMAVLAREDHLRRKGIKVITIFEDCLKDTRLPLEKVTIEGKTRIFSISPVQFTIAFKVYFMDFMAAYMEARLKLNHAIGIRPDSSEWAKLAGKMHFHNANQNFLSGDYKNFGPTLSLQVMSYAAKVILEWCKHYYGNETPEQKEDNLVRSLLLNEIIESVHLCFDNLYQVLCGAPSGSPITVILNEMVNEIYMYCAYHHLATTKKKMFCRDLSSIDCYHRHVLKCGYGDDIILNVHDDVKYFFNHYNIAEFFRQHNIGYTDAEKSGSDNVQFKSSIQEITFLKRAFQPHPYLDGQFLAPLNMDYSVKEVINWRSDRLPPKLGTEQSIEACSMNAYGHGPDIHNKIRQKCNSALIKIKSDKHLRTWKELDRIFFSDFYPKDPVSSGSSAEDNSQNSLLVSQNFTALDLDCLVLK